MSVKPIPEGYSTLTPYLIVPDGDAALRFYADAFGATETMRLRYPDGGVAHAEMRIGDSVCMLASATPDMDVAAPSESQWPTVSLTLYVEDCDASFERAVAAGCVAEQPPTEMFWGDRMAKLRCPHGHRWTVMTCVREVSVEQAQAAMDAMMAAGEPIE
ncbi:MAG: VOC family protein [Planctomycetota bacterium]